MTCCTGIIAEYNPFHNGHRFHIERTKAQNGGRPVIVAMSGSFSAAMLRHMTHMFAPNGRLRAERTSC